MEGKFDRLHSEIVYPPSPQMSPIQVQTREQTCRSQVWNLHRSTMLIKWVRRRKSISPTG